VKRGLLLLLGIAAAVAAVSAQTPRPTFEVASIKRIDKPVTFRGFPTGPIRGGTVTLMNSTVASLIQFAYGLRDFQVVDGPDWVRKDLFEVQARAAGEPARADVQLMLQSLLEERFGLRLRKEQWEMRFFAMVPARSDGSLGPYLHRVPDTGPCSNPQELEGEKTRPKPAQGSAMAMAGFSCGSLSVLAELASRNVELPVFDRTGLSGRWSATLYFAPDPNLRVGNSFGPPPAAGTVSVDPNLVSFPSALQEQLGLKLEATRGPVDVMVIAAVRQPTEN
jgi:uncharacterized protein (TIGR03435 family)